MRGYGRRSHRHKLQPQGTHTATLPPSPSQTVAVAAIAEMRVRGSFTALFKCPRRRRKRRPSGLD